MITMSERPLTLEESEKRILELEKTVSELKRTEEELSQIFSMSLDMICIADIETATFLKVNPAFTETLGFPEDALLGKSFFDFLHPDDITPTRSVVEDKLRAGKKLINFENRHLCQDGSYRWLSWTSHPVPEQGKAYTIARDITELKKASHELNESEKRYRRVVENANESIIVTQEGMLKFVNNKTYEMSGYAREELMSKPFIEFVHPDDHSMVMQHHIKRLKGEETCEKYVLRFVAKDGNIKWIENNGVVITWEGRPATLNFITDITDRKRAEEALRESEERFRQVYNHMSIGVAKVSLEFKIEAANPAYCKMLGYSEKELIGKHLREITHPDFLEKNILKQSRLAAGEIDHFRMEKRFIHKNSKIVHGILDASLVRDYNGRPLYFLGSVADISDRKRAEEALRESEEKYRSMMDSMKDAAYICSPELLIEYMNPRMISTVGRDATGDCCYKAIYGFDEKCSWCVLDNVLQGEHIDYELENPKDNRFYSVTNSPIHHSRGTISKLTIFRDVTDSKSIEAQLHQARKMESIGTIAGGIAHDFNNILYMITGNAELAMEDIPAWNPAHENLKEIKSAGLRAAGVVKQLLNFSHQTDQELKPIDAVIVIKDALKLLRSTIPASIEIQQKFPEKEVIILGDPTKINQLMMNLCINASQAMEEAGGILDILVEMISLNERKNDLYSDPAPGDWLKITVRDSGPGIRSDIIDRIFDPYFTTKDVGKGSGMGLAVVHGIVKNHHGTILAHTEPGQGMTFTIFLPVLTKRPAMETKASDFIPRGTGERVLFVDDEASITGMIEKMLERLRYRVQTTTSPLDALEMFRSKPDFFDLVLTDMTMPKMTGVELSKKLKEIKPDIPVVICTGHNALIDEEKAKSISVEDYVMKPILMRDIAKVIRKVLDKTTDS